MLSGYWSDHKALWYQLFVDGTSKRQMPIKMLVKGVLEDRHIDQGNMSSYTYVEERLPVKQVKDIQEKVLIFIVMCHVTFDSFKVSTSVTILLHATTQQNQEHD